jgi:hypothetical protein
MPLDSTLLSTRSIDEYNFKFNLVPNPSNGNCVLSTTQNLNNCHVSICNLLGEELWNYSLSELPAYHKIILPFSGFSRGTYLVKIRSNNEFAVQKLIRN